MNPELIIAFVRLLADDTHLDPFDMGELADLRDAVRSLDYTLAKYLDVHGVELSDGEQAAQFVEGFVEGWTIADA